MSGDATASRVTHTVTLKCILQSGEDEQSLRGLLIRYRVRTQLSHEPFQFGEYFTDTRGGRSRGHQLRATILSMTATTLRLQLTSSSASWRTSFIACSSSMVAEGSRDA